MYIGTLPADPLQSPNSADIRYRPTGTTSLQATPSWILPISWTPSFTKISLNGPCYGPCPVYSVTFSRDGPAEFVVWRTRHDLGGIAHEPTFSDFARLCYLLERLRVPDMKSYSYPATDMESVTIRLEYALPGKPPTVVSDYGQAGPIDLWAAQCAIDASQRRPTGSRRHDERAS